jgi:hypothetical protein
MQLFMVHDGRVGWNFRSLVRPGFLSKDKIARVFDTVNIVGSTGAGIAQTLLVRCYGSGTLSYARAARASN